mgnify:CR=1 FL=1
MSGRRVIEGQSAARIVIGRAGVAIQTSHPHESAYTHFNSSTVLYNRPFNSTAAQFACQVWYRCGSWYQLVPGCNEKDTAFEQVTSHLLVGSCDVGPPI